MTTHGSLPPAPVRHPTILHRWESVTFLHWSYPLDTVGALVPPGLEVEAREGRAWVSLILLRMHLRVPVGPRWPMTPPFPETNVRTYVVGPDGRPGIWFFSLDAGSPSAVAMARLGYRLPYFLARMELDDAGGPIRYRSRRRYPGPAGAGHDVDVVPGRAWEPGELAEMDHFLTARFSLWQQVGPVVVRTPVEHGAWPLRRVQVVNCREDLLAAAGLPPGDPAPLAHFSPGVDVRIGAPAIRAPRSVRAAGRADWPAPSARSHQGTPGRLRASGL